MSTINRLNLTTDITSEKGRGDLQETLDLLAGRIQLLTKELELVKEADQIVQAAPIQEYPAITGVLASSSDVPLGTIANFPNIGVPPGWARCDGTLLSTSAYPELFSLLGYTFGGGGASFALPDLRDRMIVGAGSSYGVGSTGGAATHTLSQNEIPSHTHTVNDPGHSHSQPAHTHDMGNHTHADPNHTHATTFYPAGGGAGNVGPATTSNGGAPVNYGTTTNNGGSTGGPSTNTTGAGGGDVTQNALSNITISGGGSGQAHNNMPPYMGHQFMIYIGSGSQAISVSWGRVNGSVALLTPSQLPVTATRQETLIELRSEQLARIQSYQAASGAGTDTISCEGTIQVPYNFRRWRADGIRIRTKLNMSGVGSNASVSLRVSNPISPGAYLPSTYSRTLTQSGGSLGDSSYVWAQLKAEDLGPEWKAGYLLHFEVQVTVPLTFTSLTLDFGRLEINWR